MTSTGSERRRLAFIKASQGEEAMLEFAERTMVNYRRAVLSNGKNGRKVHFASLREYKEAFIRSYLVLKAVVLESRQCQPT